MNTSLLNPFDVDWPEVFDGVMTGTDGATCASFNKWGTLLATGTVFGHVMVWDFETRGVARKLEHDLHSQAHPSAINSVSWTSNGRKLLGSAMKSVFQWDVQSGSIDHTVPFRSQILGADQHPCDMSLCAICFDGHPPVLAQLKCSEASLLVIIESHPDRSKSLPKCVRFSENGEFLFIGWSQSGVTKHNSKSLELLSSAGFTGSGPHTQLFLGVNSTLLVTSNDRVRVCDAHTLQLRKDLCDVVNRTQIYSSSLSNNGEYVAAGALHKSSPHSVYIWSVVDGSLVALLDGSSLGIVSLLWHPSIPLLVAVVKSQHIVVWSKNLNKNWSAFAPDFVELHENVIVRDEDENQTLENDASSGTDEFVDIGDRSMTMITDDDLKHIPVSPRTS